MNDLFFVLHREFVYLRYYFELQLRQIFWYWIFGMAIGSFISVFAKDRIHRLFAGMKEKEWGVSGIIPACLLGIASPLCMYGTIPIAAWIAEQAGCETMEIRTEDAYPASYNETIDLAKQEQNEAFRPQLEPDEKSVEDYDTIYLVFPNWWGDLPMPVYSFLDSHDLTGKTVKVFVTHEGSSFSNTVGTIAELEPGAEVLEGLAVRGANVSDEENNIRNWVTENLD